MGKFFAALILISLLVVGMNVASLIWAGAKDPPSDAFTALTTLPPSAPANATENGYFLLLGFIASPSLDPVKTGFEMWQEADSMRGHLYYDYTKEARATFQMPPELIQTIQAWKGEDLVTQMDKYEHTLDNFTTRYSLLLDRYARWLTMPFEDEGFHHPSTPRLAELFLTHRVYLATGFRQSLAKGLDRLEKDLALWRKIMEHGKILSLDILAASAVSDDARLISALLNRQPDGATVARLADMASPLTKEERSLRWPIQREFMKGLIRFKHITVPQSDVPRQQSEENRHWVTTLANIKVDAFDQITLPFPQNFILRAMAMKQRTLNIYADYYDTLIKSSETLPVRLPKLHDIAKKDLQGPFDRLTNPIDNVFFSAAEPPWEPFMAHVVETDALLRLVGLQIILQKAPPQQPVATTIGKAGSAYFDPFTGFPMIWNASQKALYSVGKDGRDDGGESSFDISIKLVTLPPPPPPPDAKPPVKPLKPVKPVKPAAKPAPKPASKPAPKETAPAPAASAPPAPAATTPPVPPPPTPPAPAATTPPVPPPPAPPAPAASTPAN